MLANLSPSLWRRLCPAAAAAADSPRPADFSVQPFEPIAHVMQQSGSLDSRFSSSEYTKHRCASFWP